MSDRTCLYCNTKFDVLEDKKSTVIVIGYDIDEETQFKEPRTVFVCGECSKYIPFSAAAEKEDKDESI